MRLIWYYVQLCSLLTGFAPNYFMIAILSPHTLSRPHDECCTPRRTRLLTNAYFTNVSLFYKHDSISLPTQCTTRLCTVSDSPRRSPTIPGRPKHRSKCNTGLSNTAIPRRSQHRTECSTGLTYSVPTGTYARASIPLSTTTSKSLI